MLHELRLCARSGAADLQSADDRAAVCGRLLPLPALGAEADISAQIKNRPFEGGTISADLSFAKQKVGHERRNEFHWL